MKPINDVRRALLDPRLTEERIELKKNLKYVPSLASAGMAASAVVSAIGLVATKKIPIIGSIIAFCGAVALIGSREIKVLASNAQKILETGCCSRLWAITSAKKLTNQLTQSSWVVGPLLGPYIEDQLNVNH